ncbi:MAG: bifunctional [glutamate--ammonia ligase]-adenylyl-L-tyrosine phosphorylase/[glutamate--ammonia-ligase] adenylyltransferase, partial [Pseudohongiellaceae bacterium]
EKEAASRLLLEYGFSEPDKILEEISAYRDSRQFLALEKIGRERLNRFMAVLLEAVSRSATPDLAFTRVFSFVQHVTRRTSYLILLLENRVALTQLIELCEASPWVVDHLSKYPVLLDELLKPITVPPERDELADDLRQNMIRLAGDDLDQQMETLRYFKLVHVLKVAAAELAETLPLMKVSDYLTYIAEVLLQQVLELAWDELVSRFGYPVDSKGEAGNLDFTVIAYGKLGGIELNYGSDLDLVFLHDGDADCDTEAGEQQRAINSRAFYARLGQRIINILNTWTMSGRLYEVDMRLRPSGASGLLVTSLAAFRRYQEQDAWTWEHQALIRSRAVGGSPHLAEEFSRIRKEVLKRRRDDSELKKEICAMRRRMRKELGSGKRQRFNIKQDAGGLVDIEFMVQYIVLARAWQCEGLLAWSDNMRLLEVMKDQALLPVDQVQSLMDIYIRYRIRLHRLALQNIDDDLPEDEYQEERACIIAIWQSLFPEDESGSE